MQGHAPLAGIGRDDAHRLRIHGANAVNGGRNAGAVRFFELIHAARPAVRVAIAEGELFGLERPAVHPAAQVAGVDERDADALLTRRVDERLAKFVAMAVEVVELSHRGDSRLQHFPKQEPRVFEVVGRIPFSEAIHLGAPLPEVAAAGLDLAPQQPLERVAVDVGEPRHSPALECDGIGGCRDAFFDRAYPTVFDLDQHVLCAMTQPRLLGVPAARSVHSRIGIWTPRSRATSIARW